MTSTESRKPYADRGQIQPANTLGRLDKVIPSRERAAAPAKLSTAGQIGCSSVINPCAGSAARSVL